MIKPTQNRLLVRVQAEVIKKGEENKGDALMTAEVLQVGPAVEHIVVGELVTFAPYGLDEISVDGEKLILIVEDLILAIHEKGTQKSNTKTKK